MGTYREMLSVSLVCFPSCAAHTRAFAARVMLARAAMELMLAWLMLSCRAMMRAVGPALEPSGQSRLRCCASIGMANATGRQSVVLSNLVAWKPYPHLQHSKPGMLVVVVQRSWKQHPSVVMLFHRNVR